MNVLEIMQFIEVNKKDKYCNNTERYWDIENVLDNTQFYYRSKQERCGKK